jgi:hypothetical protein
MFSGPDPGSRGSRESRIVPRLECEEPLSKCLSNGRNWLGPLSCQAAEPPRHRIYAAGARGVASMVGGTLSQAFSSSERASITLTPSFDCVGFRVQGPGSRVQGPGFRVQGSGCGVWGLEFGVQGLGETHLVEYLAALGRPELARAPEKHNLLKGVFSGRSLVQSGVFRKGSCPELVFSFPFHAPKNHNLSSRVGNFTRPS